MKPIHLITVLPAINNVWAFSAFLVVVAVTLLFSRSGVR